MADALTSEHLAALPTLIDGDDTYKVVGYREPREGDYYLTRTCEVYEASTMGTPIALADDEPVARPILQRIATNQSKEGGERD